jgi:hypothetical protein
MNIDLDSFDSMYEDYNTEDLIGLYDMYYDKLVSVAKALKDKRDQAIIQELGGQTSMQIGNLQIVYSTIEGRRELISLDELQKILKGSKANYMEFYSMEPKTIADIEKLQKKYDLPDSIFTKKESKTKKLTITNV